MLNKISCIHLLIKILNVKMYRCFFTKYSKLESPEMQRVHSYLRETTTFSWREPNCRHSRALYKVCVRVCVCVCSLFTTAGVSLYGRPPSGDIRRHMLFKKKQLLWGSPSSAASQTLTAPEAGNTHGTLKRRKAFVSLPEVSETNETNTN